MDLSLVGAKKLSCNTQLINPQTLASFFKAAGDPLRLEILRALRYDTFGVSELAFIFAMPQPGMSHHLKILSNSKLLSTRRQGNIIFYRRALVSDKSISDNLQKNLFKAVDLIELEEIFQERINKVYADRAQQSQNFFNKNVDKFSENQGRLCELSEYIEGLRDLLNLANLAYNSRVLEVGPGQGLFLEELAGRFEKVVALDSSEEMLSLAKSMIESQSSKIKFVNKSLEAYSTSGDCFDAVVLNMVMHHLPSPAGIFKKIESLLDQSGFLLIADLCSHHQAWVRDSCGDLWLGFEPEDITNWSADYFNEVQSLYLGLKNGFQIQLRLFKKIA